VPSGEDDAQYQRHDGKRLNRAEHTLVNAIVQVDGWGWIFLGAPACLRETSEGIRLRAPAGSARRVGRLGP